MKNIEINTTQNVTLEYELADLRERIIAYLIDLTIMIGSITILFLIGFNGFELVDSAAQAFLIFLFCIFIFYTLLIEIFNNGQSVGKMAMKIRVIKMVGGSATYSDYVARWVFRMIDIYLSLGGIASVLIASSGKAQRIGDVVANTAVVKLTPTMDLKLEDILGIQTKESFKPVYPEAKKLLEQDVLLIKTTLKRSIEFKNDAHDEAVALLAEQIRTVLGLTPQDGNDQMFLQTVLKDYVVMTR